MTRSSACIRPALKGIVLKVL
uniref:Uncharacterized protein n=1 Tax=Anguilla anguilla TaxID=7936 RepID=A0A0E9PJT9_ANGAN